MKSHIYMDTIYCKTAFKYCLLSCLLLLLIPYVSNAQSFNQGTIAQQYYHDTIPFELIKGKIIVDVQIHGKTRKFLFDTGAPLVISPTLQEEMKNEVINTGKLKDISGRAKTVEMVLVPEFSLGAIGFQQSAGVVQALDNGMLACFEIGGIVGSNVLRHSVVYIDAANKFLIITQEAAMLGLNDAYKTKLKLDDQSRPIITLTIDKAKIPALFDSGSDKFMNLSGKTYKQLKRKEQVQTINEGLGSSSSGVFGAAAFDKQYRVQISNLALGMATINNAIANANDDKKKNAVGMQLTEYGTVTIDFPNKEFYISPKAANQSFKVNTTFGFVPQYDKDHFRAGIVYANTMAAKQGLQSGDRILRINDFDVSNNDIEQDCALFLSNVQQQDEMTLTFVDKNDEVKTIQLKQE